MVVVVVASAATAATAAVAQWALIDALSASLSVCHYHFLASKASGVHIEVHLYQEENF